MLTLLSLCFLNSFVSSALYFLVSLFRTTGFVLFILTKNSRTFQGLSRTHFLFFKDSNQCKKEPRLYVFFSSSTTWVILSWKSFCVCSFFFGVLNLNYEVSIEIKGLSSTDCNFQGLSRGVRTLLEQGQKPLKKSLGQNFRQNVCRLIFPCECWGQWLSSTGHQCKLLVRTRVGKS